MDKLKDFQIKKFYSILLKCQVIINFNMNLLLKQFYYLLLSICHLSKVVKNIVKTF